MKREVLNKSRALKRRFIFFGRNSNIQGLRFIVEDNGTLPKRLFWILVLVASAGCLYLLLLPLTERSSVVSFTPDTLYLKWQTTFPAVTVCEAYNYKQALKMFTDLYPEVMASLDFSQRKHFTDILYGTGTCSKSLCGPCGEQVACDLPWRLYADKVRKRCEDLIKECSYNGHPFECCKKFHSVDSETGTCYAINSLQSRDFLNEELFSVNLTTGPGTLTFRLLVDAQISVHSPEELATDILDAKLKFDVHTKEKDWVEFLFSVVEMDSDPMFRQESIEHRECRYLREVPRDRINNYPVYSYGACKLARDTEQTYRHCGCIHPVRDLSYKEMFCNYTGINCVITFEGLRAATSVGKEDFAKDCLPSCVESELTAIHVTKRWTHHGGGTLVNIRMASIPNLRYRRNMLRSDLDLVVSIGGLAGLFFGASILSVAETVYLLLRKPISN